MRLSVVEAEFCNVSRIGFLGPAIYLSLENSGNLLVRVQLRRKEPSVVVLIRDLTLLPIPSLVARLVESGVHSGLAILNEVALNDLVVHFDSAILGHRLHVEGLSELGRGVTRKLGLEWLRRVLETWHAVRVELPHRRLLPFD